MADIHPNAVVDPAASIADDVRIGPFCVIGPRVTIGAGCVLHSHVALDGDTVLGENNQIFPFASIGHMPQDLKFFGENSRLEIGSNNTIREYVTMNPGTEGGGLTTKVGNDGLFMAGSHVAHDCIVGDHVILANNATLAGHVEAGDFAIFGGLSAVHQFARIGAHAFVGGMCGVENDVIPYGSVIGNRADLAGLNLVGLRRRGFDKADIHALRAGYKALFTGEGTVAERAEAVAKDYADAKLVMEVVQFIRDGGSRALCTPRVRGE